MRDAASLDNARRTWLAGLAEARRRMPDAAHTLAHAQGAWQCGEYDVALDAFRSALTIAPADPDILLALARAASMLGRRSIERAALAHADIRGLSTPLLDLHRALFHIPGNWAAARALLARHPGDPTCALFAEALDAINGVPLARSADAGRQARLDGLGWVLRHAHDPNVHVGLPSAVLQHALDAMPPEGLVLECGVYFGRSLGLLAGRVEGTVHGFDSFQGLPEAWNPREPAGAYSTAGRLPRVRDNVVLHVGWFEDTLAPFCAHTPGPVRLLHVDCDLYSATRTVLQAFGPRLQQGSIVVFDDFLGYPGFECHEFRAWDEFCASAGVGFEVISACLLGREVALRVTKP